MKICGTWLVALSPMLLMILLEFTGKTGEGRKCCLRLPRVDDIMSNPTIVGVKRRCPWEVHGSGCEGEDERPAGGFGSSYYRKGLYYYIIILYYYIIGRDHIIRLPIIREFKLMSFELQSCLSTTSANFSQCIYNWGKVQRLTSAHPLDLRSFFSIFSHLARPSQHSIFLLRYKNK